VGWYGELVSVDRSETSINASRGREGTNLVNIEYITRTNVFVEVAGNVSSIVIFHEQGVSVQREIFHEASQLNISQVTGY